ncbi:MAG: histone deacetylase [Candidatus Aenigmarchaeota archaeon]|nr:histone deacetylase [Candidatus Aenigmarchaeota archaeon]
MTAIIYHRDYLEHETGNHPENKYRLIAIMNEIQDSNLNINIIKPKQASIDEVNLVHTPNYIKKVAKYSKNELPLDPDTITCKDSYETALFSAGGAITAVDTLDKEDNAFALVRPPRHHALPDKGMGFCLFNNIGIGAKYALDKKGYERVMIIDWDVHHGNGTQNIFYDDPSVFYFSIHQLPCYPGTGFSEERGLGKGERFTKNIPLPPGSGDKEYLDIFEKYLAPAADKYKPDLILVSAGFDAHIDDPMADMNVTGKGFEKMASEVYSIADKHCDGKLAMVLEGGYNPRALSYSVKKVLEVMSE